MNRPDCMQIGSPKIFVADTLSTIAISPEPYRFVKGLIFCLSLGTEGPEVVSSDSSAGTEARLILSNI